MLESFSPLQVIHSYIHRCILPNTKQVREMQTPRTNRVVYSSPELCVSACSSSRCSCLTFSHVFTIAAACASSCIFIQSFSARVVKSLAIDWPEHIPSALLLNVKIGTWDWSTIVALLYFNHLYDSPYLAVCYALCLLSLMCSACSPLKCPNLRTVVSVGFLSDCISYRWTVFRNCSLRTLKVVLSLLLCHMFGHVSVKQSHT